MDRRWMFAVVVVACSKTETTPAGPVGATLDLRPHITKPEVRAHAPADDAAAKQELAVDVHGVKAKLVWRTFDDGDAKYIVSATWEVLTPVAGITIVPLGALNPENAGTWAKPIQQEIIRVGWHGDHSGGELSVRIDAAGTGSVMP